MIQEFQTTDLPEEPIVSFYELPLDEKAAVTSFRAEIDERVIEGVVKEREQAREEFDQAVKEGKNAYLGEQTRSDIFHISLGNLPTGKVVRIVVVYMAPIESVGTDLLKFVLPTAISPRYDPWHNSQEPIPAGQKFINEGVHIRLSLLLDDALKAITSTTTEIDIRFDAPVVIVDVIDNNPLERDVVIDIQLAHQSRPQVYLESREANAQALMLSMVPDFPEEIIEAARTQKTEFVFIVDRSGSMEVTKMEQLKKALLQILDFLRDYDVMFNIISFGNSFEPLFEGGSQHIEGNGRYQDGVAYVQSFLSNFGSTEILKPLQYVLEQEPAIGRNRIVFVITDGQVSNTDDVIQYVASDKGDNTRVFSLGIGNHVSRNLVNGIARSGGGFSDFVDGESDTAITAAVTRQMTTALAPNMDNLQLNFQFVNETSATAPINIIHAPYRPPPHLSNQRFLMFFLIESQEELESMTLSADMVGGSDLLEPVSFAFDREDIVDVPDNTGSSFPVHTMTARELIRDLEEGTSWLHDDTYVNPESVRQEIISLGIEYQIASSETSFVAVDESSNESFPQEEGGESLDGSSSGGSGGDDNDDWDNSEDSAAALILLSNAALCSLLLLALSAMWW
jgi:von Willebrand factor A domain-containing protein 5